MDPQDKVAFTQFAMEMFAGTHHGVEFRHRRKIPMIEVYQLAGNYWITITFKKNKIVSYAFNDKGELVEDQIEGA
jgi:hypothetical protein